MACGPKSSVKMMGLLLRDALTQHKELSSFYLVFIHSMN